jgi:hypothetical protein
MDNLILMYIKNKGNINFLNNEDNKYTFNNITYTHEEISHIVEAHQLYKDQQQGLVPSAKTFGNIRSQRRLGLQYSGEAALLIKTF